jgi:hypothetical protein
LHDIDSVTNKLFSKKKMGLCPYSFATALQRNFNETAEFALKKQSQVQGNTPAVNLRIINEYARHRNIQLIAMPGGVALLA